MWTESEPFEEIQADFPLMQAITSGRHPSRDQSKREIPNELWNAMVVCWQIKPSDRLGAGDLLQQLTALIASISSSST